ncbi:Uncharacterised protein [Streptococcus constellatus]|uniref:Uncharacterized protein n=1 Tax=Streptococcus constellatus TaxID=76860 RepID=A0A564TKN6_STRCV|nr:hypothetical protein [Streptococcus constellatus]VUW97505.1 Uncharacterised protein [Streptococcus gordonii]VUX07818.1 Uncharacterised protein [Streptococcus constellatus]
MSEIEKPILTLEQDRFLKNKSFDTYKKKLEVLSRAYSANAMKTNNGFSLDSEEQYKALFEAVFSGVWDVDTGMRYVNVTEIIGVSSFLAGQKDENGYYIRNSDGEIVWDVVDIDEAELFTEEQIATIVPKEYRGKAFVLRELDARKEWGDRQPVEDNTATVQPVEETIVEVEPEPVVQPDPAVETHTVSQQKPVVKPDPVVKPLPMTKAEKQQQKKDYTKESIKIINATIDSLG